MGELISLRRLRMWNLSQQLWWYRAVKDKVAIEQLYFLHGFPPPYWRWGWCGTWFIVVAVVIHSRLRMRVGTVGRVWL
jgi:hypothetical protein